MIPKIIHYCWFGKSNKPEAINKCISTWRELLPDYEIREWNEDTFDVNSNNFTKEAYAHKKYAFVSDYVRLFALYNYGGVYLDTDVEVIQSLDKFLVHSAFTGCENTEMCVTGTMGAVIYHPWIEMLLNDYENKSFVNADGTHNLVTNTKQITKLTIENFEWQKKDVLQVLKNDLNIYPSDVFCAKNWRTGEIFASQNTYTIHHFSGSWHTKTDKMKKIIINFMPNKLFQYYKKIRRK